MFALAACVQRDADRIEVDSIVKGHRFVLPLDDGRGHLGSDPRPLALVAEVLLMALLIAKGARVLGAAQIRMLRRLALELACAALVKLAHGEVLDIRLADVGLLVVALSGRNRECLGAALAEVGAATFVLGQEGAGDVVIDRRNGVSERLATEGAVGRTILGAIRLGQHGLAWLARWLLLWVIRLLLVSRLR